MMRHLTAAALLLPLAVAQYGCCCCGCPGGSPSSNWDLGPNTSMEGVEVAPVEVAPVEVAEPATPAPDAATAAAPTRNCGDESYHCEQACEETHWSCVTSCEDIVTGPCAEACDETRDRCTHVCDEARWACQAGN